MIYLFRKESLSIPKNRNCKWYLKENDWYKVFRLLSFIGVYTKSKRFKRFEEKEIEKCDSISHSRNSRF